MALLINDAELDALEGQPAMLMVLYVYLRRFMDYGTGIVGFKRGISYQSIAEALYREPEPGVKSGSPTKWAIQRALHRLERAGLLQRTGGLDNLVFLMPKAQTDKSARKQAAIKPLHLQQPPEPILEAKKSQAATPPVSGFPVVNTTTIDISQSGGGECLIFPNRTHEASKAAMQKMLRGFDQKTAQELLDEVTGYIENKKVRVTPEALLQGLVKLAKVGDFIPTLAPRVKQRRDAPPAEPGKPLPKITETDRQNAAKHRGKITEIFGKRRA